jgi:SAM-dependent methyltransferase
VSSQGLVIAEDFYRGVLFSKVNSETEWLDVSFARECVREWLPDDTADQIALSKRARRLIGVNAVPQADGRNPFLHERIVGDVNHLPFPDATFNLVTTQIVMADLVRPNDFLKEIRRVLRPGGRLIFLAPNNLDPQIIAASILPGSWKKLILQYFYGRSESGAREAYGRMSTREWVFELAGHCGYSVERINMLHSNWKFRCARPLQWLERTIHRILALDQFSRFRSDILAVLVNQ